MVNLELEIAPQKKVRGSSPVFVVAQFAVSSNILTIFFKKIWTNHTKIKNSTPHCQIIVRVPHDSLQNDEVIVEMNLLLKQYFLGL